MVQPIDQGAILASGRGLAGNYAEQALRQAMLGVQQQEAETQSLNAVRLQAKDQREVQRQTQFQAEVEALGANPSSQAIVNLMLRYPEFSEGVRRSFQSKDETQQRIDRRQMAEIAWAATRGDYPRALASWRQRLEADRAAGQEPDAAESAILADLESGDPARQRAAAEAIGHLYASTGSNVATDLEALGLRARIESASPGEVLYNPDTREVIGQSPASRIIPGQQGSFYEAPPIPGVPLLGGGPAPAPPAADAGGREDGGAFAGVDGASGAPSAARWTYGGGPARNARDGGKRDHLGHDLMAPAGTPLPLNQPFTVLNPRSGGTGGNRVTVRMEDGTEWIAMHLPNLPRPGRYPAGAPVLMAGNTGNAARTDSHIHWQAANAAARRVDVRTYLGLGGRGGGGTGGGSVRVRSRQEYNRLAPGTRYIDPNGVTRTKS